MLIATCLYWRLMTNGSLTYSVGWKAKSGLLSMKSYSRRVPMQKLHTMTPRSIVLRAPLTAPASTRSMMESVSISVWMPRSFLVFRNSTAAWGMRPMPSSTVDASSTSAATNSPMRSVVGLGLGGRYSMTADCTGTSTSMSVTWTKLSPSVRGISGLISAMTKLAFSAAALTMSTDTPRLHMPRASGGVTWMSAASSGSCPELKRRGMSERKIGV